MVKQLPGDNSKIAREDLSIPLILTLDIEPEAQKYFDGLRKAYFPPERNFIDAHLTLFHALPDDLGVHEHLELISKQQAAFYLNAASVVSIGNGTAIKIDCPSLKILHAQLQTNWFDFLTPQDRQKIWPHITVQNKVHPDDAKFLQNALAENFEPFSFTTSGLKLWRYLGGPSEFVSYFAFKQ